MGSYLIYEINGLEETFEDKPLFYYICMCKEMPVIMVNRVADKKE
jgi:hypothetical protein